MDGHRQRICFYGECLFTGPKVDLYSSLELFWLDQAGLFPDRSGVIFLNVREW
jgi:hypothetical protein